MSTPFLKARAVFDAYCAMAPPHLPHIGEEVAAAQVAMARWVATKVNHTLPASVENALGANEEWGEYFEARVTMALGKLAHYELNVSQSRRYNGLSVEELRAKKADAIADAAVFLMALCTAERLDFGTLLTETVKEVVQRDWKANPDKAHERVSETVRPRNVQTHEVRGWEARAIRADGRPPAWDGIEQAQQDLEDDVCPCGEHLPAWVQKKHDSTRRINFGEGKLFVELDLCEDCDRVLEGSNLCLHCGHVNGVSR